MTTKHITLHTDALANKLIDLYKSSINNNQTNKQSTQYQNTCYNSPPNTFSQYTPTRTYQEKYWFISPSGHVHETIEMFTSIDNDRYNSGNYYDSKVDALHTLLR